MKGMIEDRIILLATAQECMDNVSDKFSEWDKSQLSLEKSAFDSLNDSDLVLNLSKEGSLLVGRLLECCSNVMKNPSAEENNKMEAVLKEVHEVFSNISNASTRVNEISHIIEGEAANQRVIEEEIKASLSHVSESIDACIACAELSIADE